MVHPMVRRGVEHSLEPGRHTPDRLGVDPELVDEADPLLDEDLRRRESEEGQGQPEKPRPDQASGPGLPQGRRQVVMLGGVVVDVRRPPEAPLVAQPVEDIVDQVIEEEDRHPAPPGGERHGEDPVLPGPDRGRENKARCKKSGYAAQKTHGKGGQGIPGLVLGPGQTQTPQTDLKQDRENEEGDGQLHRVERGFQHQFVSGAHPARAGRARRGLTPDRLRCRRPSRTGAAAASVQARSRATQASPRRNR